jgi:hypothetical protein
MATDITIADAQATPVTHTFTPMGFDPNETYWYVDSSQTNALGYWKLGIAITRPPQPSVRQSSQDRNYRVKVQLLEPVLANVTNSTVSGVEPAPQLAYAMRAYTEFVLAEAGTALDRKNIAKMHPLALQNAQVKAVIENLSYPGL